MFVCNSVSSCGELWRKLTIREKVKQSNNCNCDLVYKLHGYFTDIAISPIHRHTEIITADAGAENVDIQRRLVINAERMGRRCERSVQATKFVKIHGSW